MVEALGFGYVAPDILLGLILIALMAATVTGWITDLIMGKMGLGVIGNTMLTLVGTVATVAAWNRVIGRVTASDPLVILTAIAIVVLVLLLLVASLKRLT